MPPSPPPSASLKRDRDFVLFLAGQAASALGDSARLVLLPLLVLHLTGSGTAMGLVAMLEALPTLLLGLPAGTLADRWDRRRMMFYSDAARTVLIALIPLSILLDLDTVAVVVVVAVPLGILEQSFEAACIPCVPALVGRERVAAANAWLQAFNSVGFVAGPAVAGVLAASIGPGRALWLDAASFAVSAATLAAIRRPLQHHVPGDAPPLRWRVLAAEMRDGARHILSIPALRAAVFLRGGVMFMAAPLVPVATFFLERDIGAASAIGWVMTSYCVGSLLGSVISSQLEERSLGRAMVLASTAAGAALAGLAASSGLALLIVLAAATGAAFSVQQIAHQTFCAAATPDQLLGRVSGTVRVFTFSLNPISLLVAGVLLDATSGRTVLAGMGGLTLLLGIAFASALRAPLPGTLAR